MTTDPDDKRTRQWGGFALGVLFLLNGAIPGVFDGWQTSSYIFAIGGSVITTGNVIWIIWSRHHDRSKPPRDE